MSTLWLDYATKRDLSNIFTAKRSLSSIECVVFHVTAGGATSPYTHFKSTRRGCSTGWIGYDRTEQYLPLDTISYSEIEGGVRIVSWETASPADGSGTWNAYQLAMIARICADMHKRFGVPVKLMTNTSDKGIGWHRLGVRGNFPSGLLGGYNQRGGKGPVWSSAFGKVCPGDGRIRQMGTILSMVTERIGGSSTGGTVGGTSKPVTPAPAKPSVPKPSRTVLAWQKDLNRYAKAGIVEDGIRGPVVIAWENWVADCQRALNAFKVTWPRRKLRIDKHYGSVTANYARDVQKRNRLVRDGMVGPVMIRWMRTKGSSIPDRPANRP